MFQQSSHFPQTSLFRRSEDHEMARDRQRRRSRPPTETPMVSHDELEDWAHRLGQCAAEADDSGLYNLESDLLDIRDEMLLAIEV